MSARKVFIYNSSGTDSLWFDDFYSLFTTSEKIFPVRPDVQLCDFTFNMTDVKNPIFVIPGGSTAQIGMKLKRDKIREKIASHFGNKFSYVSVCAGTFLGVGDADLFHTTHKSSTVGFEPAISLISTKDAGIAFNVIENYRAIGSFYPNQNYLGFTPQSIMPYSVPVVFNQCKGALQLLHLQGPALYLAHSKPEAKTANEEVVATFIEGENYKKTNKHLNVVGEQPLAAIVRKPPAENNGGSLISCVHIEACVRDSKVLKFFQTPTKESPGLKKEEYDLLASQQNETQEQVEGLLRDTLKLMPS